jgi:glycine/D-amino acid oxidase-like deaminating enzyme
MLVIGGGIAGSSVAYFASSAGWAVTVLDAEAGPSGRASDVPSALLDPVRGNSGQIDARTLTGLRLSWSLIRHLSERGYPVPHEQDGVLRPLTTDVARARFERHLPADLPHHWLPTDDTPGHDRPSHDRLNQNGPTRNWPNPSWPSRSWLAPGWPHLLYLPEGGWVSGPALVAALLAESGAVVRRVRVQTWDGGSATLPGGEVLKADAVVWCGGSVGAAWGGAAALDTQTFTHRGGSLLLLEHSPAPVPVVAGVYLAPCPTPGGGRGGVLGATFEAPTTHAYASGPPLKSLHWLLSRAAALTAELSPTVTGLWTGSRLAGEYTGRQPGGWWALAGLGSKGFLLGPLLARQLVSRLDTNPAANEASG